MTSKTSNIPSITDISFQIGKHTDDFLQNVEQCKTDFLQLIGQYLNDYTYKFFTQILC